MTTKEFLTALEKRYNRLCIVVRKEKLSTYRATFVYLALIKAWQQAQCNTFQLTQEGMRELVPSLPIASFKKLAEELATKKVGISVSGSTYTINEAQVASFVASLSPLQV